MPIALHIRDGEHCRRLVPAADVGVYRELPLPTRRFTLGL